MSFPVPTRAVYVGNIPFSATDESLMQAFSEYEPISVKIVEGKGIAFIEVPARRAYAMVRDTDGSKLEGRLLSVSVARPRENQPTFTQDQDIERQERNTQRERPQGFRDDRGERPPFRRDNPGPRDQDSRPPRRDGDRPPYGQNRGGYGDRDSRPPRPDYRGGGGGRPPYNRPDQAGGEGRPPRRDFGGDRGGYGDRDSRPPRPDYRGGGGGRPPYGRPDQGNTEGRPPRRDFGDRPAPSDRNFEGRPPRSNDRGPQDRPRGGYSGGGRPDGPRPWQKPRDDAPRAKPEDGGGTPGPKRNFTPKPFRKPGRPSGGYKGPRRSN